jgi:hypothetical protein
MAVSSSSNLIFEASRAMETEPNFELLKSALIPNLKLMDGLLSQAPKNAELLFTLTKGYTGLAFMVNETDMYFDEWSGSKTEENKRQALKNYSRAYRYGMRFLETKNIQEADLFISTELTLDKGLSHSDMDLELVLFTAQSLGGMINLQKDNMTLVARLPVVKAMFDWACSKKPDLNFGACDIFYGAYESGRPKMLGGNPEKGKEYFIKAMEKFPHNWLVRTSYIQFYLIPLSDEEGFAKEMTFLEKKFSEFESYSIYKVEQQEVPTWDKEPHLRIYQALAMKRFELLNRYKKQLF